MLIKIIGPGPVLSYILTNQKPTIYRNLYENTGHEQDLGGVDMVYV